MKTLKGGVFPHIGTIPNDFEVAYQIVSELQRTNVLKIRKEMIGDMPYYIWELKIENTYIGERTE